GSISNADFSGRGRMRARTTLTRSLRRTAHGWLDRALVRLGARDPLLPPRDLKIVGSGDFRAIGREFLRHLIQLADLRPWQAILDVGCGVGRMAAPLTGYLNCSGCYHGFDIVPEAIAWCRKQITPRFPNFHFQLADVYNPLYHPAGRCRAEDFSFP